MEEAIYREDVDRMFKESVTIIVFNWPVIKLVMQNGWVGKNQKKIRDDPEAKKENMQIEFSKSDDQLIHEFIEDLSNYIIKFSCTNQDLEEWLLKEIDERFFTIVEDNSEKEIAKLVLELFEELENKKFTLFEDVKKMGATMKNIKVKGECGDKTGEGEDDSDDDQEGMEWEDSSQIGPNDLVEPELTEQEKADIQEMKEKQRAVMEEDGFTVVSDKKKKV